MIEIEKLSKTGKFTIGDSSELIGELHLDFDKTQIILYSDKTFKHLEISEIHGILHDGTKVSLIDCITTSRGEKNILIDDTVSSRRNGNYYLEVFPHYVFFGNQHIKSNDKLIYEVSFVIDDAHAIFYDFDAYGSVLSSTEDIKYIIKKEEERLNRGIEVGENPKLFYYTGKYEIFSVETEIGVISATHNPTIKFPGVHGINVVDNTRLNMTFSIQYSIKESIDSMYDLLRFIEIISGRKQNISSLTFNMAKEKEKPAFLSLYWCMLKKRDVDNESEAPHPADIPIQAAFDPESFGLVLKNWIENNCDRRAARMRYSNLISKGRRYDVDRLIGAANMFDILPESAYDKKINISQGIKDACQKAIILFKDLDPSPERDSVLSVLGRIGKATLKRKVRSRVKYISEFTGDHFIELDLVSDEAINCRNYYVHGSKSKIDYSENTELVVFFTDALEFIFAASDLIEAGWDMAKWMKDAKSDGHPFGRFKQSYSHRLMELRKIIGK